MLTDAKQKQIATLLSPNAKRIQNSYIEKISIEELIKNGITLLVEDKFKDKKELTNYAKLNREIKRFSNQLKIIHNLQINAFKEVFKVLKKNGIEFIVLKGWALSYSIYDEPYIRPKTDIDIIIEPTNHDLVKEILSKLGYSNPRGWEPTEIIDQFSMRKTLVRGIYSNIDVHLQLTNDKALQPLFTWEKLSLTSKLEPSLSVKTLSKPDALIHAIIHLLHHACNGDFIKLIWFYDIKLLTEKLSHSELEELQEKLNINGLTNAITYVLKETLHIFPSSKIHKTIINIKNCKINKHFDYLINSPSKLRVIIRNFKHTKGILRKSKLIQETFFPPKQEIYLKYGRENKCPLSILYLRRIIAGFVKYIRNE